MFARTTTSLPRREIKQERDSTKGNDAPAREGQTGHAGRVQVGHVMRERVQHQSHDYWNLRDQGWICVATVDSPWVDGVRISIMEFRPCLCGKRSLAVSHQPHTCFNCGGAR
jgi:hypothetical protein